MVICGYMSALVKRGCIITSSPGPPSFSAAWEGLGMRLGVHYYFVKPEVTVALFSNFSTEAAQG